MDERRELELLRQLIDDKLEIFRLQQGRLKSDFESEQDNRAHLKQRVEDAIKQFEQLQYFKTTHQEEIQKFNRILFNEGRGIIFKVDRLIQQGEGSKNRLTLFISIAAIVISVIDILKDYFK